MADDTMDNSNIVFDEDWSLEDPDEGNWNRLIDEVINGNVVPVIGAEMLVEHFPNIHQTIIDQIAKRLEISGQFYSFSELIYHKEYRDKYKPDYIYSCVNSFLTQQKRLVPSSLLKRLLARRQFPFVITTSFTPFVENAMRELWGDKELRVLKFGNNPSDKEDIRDETALRCPTVYYMFGKHCTNAHRFALTDTDMLDFCSSWLSDSGERKPINLVHELSGKYLLMIGNNYSDWLFRFIWYSLRKGKMGHGMLAYNDIEDSFLHFIDRTNAFSRKNPAEVIDQIESRLSRKLQENESIKFNKPEMNADVFISYSRRDSDVARRLYEALTQLGKKVWYDRNNIAIGANFMEDINRAIRTARYFIPIFSDHITQERNDSHVYRTEWDTAIEVAKSLGRTYIIPIASESFDFYNARIPERIQQHNALKYTPDIKWEKIAQQILHEMNKN